jgi:hypothetical protein
VFPALGVISKSLTRFQASTISTSGSFVLYSNDRGGQSNNHVDLRGTQAP